MLLKIDLIFKNDVISGMLSGWYVPVSILQKNLIPVKPLAV